MRKNSCYFILATLIAVATAANAWCIDFIKVVPEGLQAEQNQAMRVRGLVPAQQFEHWVFGRVMSDEELDERLKQNLEAYINCVDGVCEFSADQLAKLELAGAGDMLAFTRRVDKMRLKVEKLDQNQIGNIWQEIQPIKQSYDRGIFVQDSLVERVMQTLLDSEQSRRLAEVKRQRCKFMHRAIVLQFVSRWEMVHPFKAEQRDEFVALLLERTRPLRSVPAATNSYLYDYYLMHEIKRIDAEKLQRLFSDESWASFDKAMKQAGRVDLKANGLEPLDVNQE